MNEANRQASQKVLNWLDHEKGWTHEIIQNNDKVLNILVHPNKEQNLNVIFDDDREDRVTLITRLTFSELDRRAFSSIPESEKRKFIINLEILLIQINIIYNILPNPPGDVHYIEMSRQIFFDALTRDKFFDGVLAILRAFQAGRLNYDSLSHRNS